MNALDIFTRSFERVSEEFVEEDKFFDSFYKHFIHKSPAIEELFNHTDMVRQAAILREAFDHLVDFYLSHEPGETLQMIAKSHGKFGLKIKPELYDLWMQALLESVKECDSKYDKQVELAWKLVLSPGIVYLKHHSGDE